MFRNSTMMQFERVSKREAIAARPSRTGSVGGLLGEAGLSGRIGQGVFAGSAGRRVGGSESGDCSVGPDMWNCKGKKGAV